MSQSDFESLNLEMQPEMIIHPEPTPEVYSNFQQRIRVGQAVPLQWRSKEGRDLHPGGECRIYLQINRKIYATDKTKVAFMLSLMKEKEALQWKQTYLKSLMNSDRKSGPVRLFALPGL
jgi:hypothetical protein